MFFKLWFLFFFFRRRKCIPPRSNAQGCGRSSDCASGHCCGVWPFKKCRECCRDSHCGQNKFCKRRKCLACSNIGQSCKKNSQCCGSTKCCGQGKLFGIVFKSGQCHAASSPCCILPQQQCNPSPIAPFKCCTGQCRQLFPGSSSYTCI